MSYGDLGFSVLRCTIIHKVVSVCFGVGIMLEMWFPLQGERAHSLYFLYVR